MILLDLDDTLVDHTGAERDAAILFGRQYAASIPGYDSQKFADAWREASEKHIAAFLRGEINFQEQRRRRIRTIFARKEMPAGEADAIFSEYLNHYQASWQLFPDVPAFLEAHADKFLAVLTDGEQEQQEAKLRRTGIRGYFHFVVSAESAGMSKPNPLFFHHACKLANLDPHQACYIGDNLQKDAIGASQAGLRGIWLNRSGKPVPAGVEAILNLTEFTLQGPATDAD